MKTHDEYVDEYMKRALPGDSRRANLTRTRSIGRRNPGRSESGRALLRSLSGRGNELRRTMFCSPSVSRQNSFSHPGVYTTPVSMEMKSVDFHEPMSRLSYTQADIEGICDDDHAFRHMKHQLRQRGCVTNMFLRQNVHLYVKGET
jgi:hypothetical protein